MTAATLTLTEFLLARIAEDEAVALRISPGRKVGAHWIAGSLEFSGTHDRDTLRHITRHDPERVLAECEAKRRLVKVAVEDESYWLQVTILGILAAVYSDHPDYRESWRP